jgi:putative acetyltransferase
MHIRLESPDQPQVLLLIEELDGYQRPLYPVESDHGIDLSALKRPDVLFAVARSDEGTAVGCGAIVLGPEYGEIKRMFVSPSVRGRGVGKQLLTFLEDCAKTKGCARFVLETGHLQTEALSLYLRSGYVRCSPFGAYSEDPNSVFMCKSAI